MYETGPGDTKEHGVKLDGYFFTDTRAGENHDLGMALLAAQPKKSARQIPPGPQS